MKGLWEPRRLEHTASGNVNTRSQPVKAYREVREVLPEARGKEAFVLGQLTVSTSVACSFPVQRTRK